MNFAFTEEQHALREAARSFLAEQCSSASVRRAAESELGYDPALWKEMGAELGWTALLIPEAQGGLGLGWVDLVALQEVLGEALAPSPFFASVCLAANAILACGGQPEQSALLPEIAAGTTRATLALAEASGRWDAEGIAASFERRGQRYALRGEKHYVVDGASADLILVAAREAGSRGADGIALFALPAATPGLVREPLPTLDATRRLARLRLDGVVLSPEARVGTGGFAPLELALQRAAVALAAEQLGGAQRALDLAVAHAKQRVQFGRPIGSFQALKHALADVMVSVESARSALYYAACVAQEGGSALPAAASMAKAVCGDAFRFASATAIQVFGGVGFTWEYDAHLYFKRARSSENLLGSSDAHRELVARAIGL